MQNITVTGWYLIAAGVCLLARILWVDSPHYRCFVVTKRWPQAVAASLVAGALLFLVLTTIRVMRDLVTVAELPAVAIAGGFLVLLCVAGAMSSWANRRR